MRRISPDESGKFHDTRQEPCRLLFMLNQSVQEKMKFLKEKNFISCAINLLRANEPMSVLFFFFCNGRFASPNARFLPSCLHRKMQRRYSVNGIPAYFHLIDRSISPTRLRSFNSKQLAVITQGNNVNKQEHN